MNIDDLQEASFKGAFLIVNSIEVTIGHNDAKKIIINSPLQNIEDLGVMQPQFVVNATITERTSEDNRVIQTYKQVRDSLTAAINKSESGDLVSPFGGTIHNVVCRTASYTESMRSVGKTKIKLNLEISNTDGVPVEDPISVPKIAELKTVLNDAAKKAVIDELEVTLTASGNFADLKSKIESAADTFETMKANVSGVKERIDAVQSKIEGYRSNAVSFVLDVNSFAVATSELIDDMASIYDDPLDVFNAMDVLGIFGDGDVALAQLTFGLIERNANRLLFNSQMKAGALGYQYQSSTETTFVSVNEIDERSNSLENTYQALIEDAPQEVIDALGELREQTNLFLENEKLNARRIVDIKTFPISARLLAYSYYGESSLGNSLAELNGLRDGTRLSGDLKVFTA